MKIGNLIFIIFVVIGLIFSIIHYLDVTEKEYGEVSCFDRKNNIINDVICTEDEPDNKKITLDITKILLASVIFGLALKILMIDLDQRNNKR